MTQNQLVCFCLSLSLLPSLALPLSLCVSLSLPLSLSLSLSLLTHTCTSGGDLVRTRSMKLIKTKTTHWLQYPRLGREGWLLAHGLSDGGRYIFNL